MQSSEDRLEIRTQMPSSQDRRTLRIAFLVLHFIASGKRSYNRGRSGWPVVAGVSRPTSATRAIVPAGRAKSPVYHSKMRREIVAADILRNERLIRWLMAIGDGPVISRSDSVHLTWWAARLSQGRNAPVVSVGHATRLPDETTPPRGGVSVELIRNGDRRDTDVFQFRD